MSCTVYCEGVQKIPLYVDKAIQYDTGSCHVYKMTQLQLKCCIIQNEFTGLCYFLVNDCKEDLYHWKQLLLQDGVITSSELYGISDSEFFIKCLPAMGCKQFTILTHIYQCKCPSCTCLSGDLSNLHNRASYSATVNSWYVLI